MSTMAYQWREGSRIKGDPQVVGESLEKIRNTTSGLTAHNVVVAAKPKSHPLHKFFTWDDQAAAQLHREEEARNLIRSVTVQIGPTEEAAPCRAFVSVGGPEDKYIPMLQVLTQTDLREKMLKTAIAELESYRVKYANLLELAPIWELLDKIKRGELVEVGSNAQ